MKKIILTALFCATLSFGTAQRKFQDLNEEQKTEIAVKRLQLKLDLNSNQVKEISPLVKKQIEFREDFKNTNTDLSSYEKRVKILDQKIQFQKSMKNILNENQYELWRKQNYKRHKAKRRMMRS